MRLWEIIRTSPFSLVQIRDRIESETINPKFQPEIHYFYDFFPNLGVAEVEVRLVRVEPVPEIGASYRVPCPIRCLEVLKDYSRIFIPIRRVAPHVKLTRTASRR